MSSWDTLQRRAKFLESRLEVERYVLQMITVLISFQVKINTYAQISQQLDTDYGDEGEKQISFVKPFMSLTEHGLLLASKEERDVAFEIERDLNEVSIVSIVATSTQ